MTMEPLVSIIIPVYGVSAFIEKCARSIFEQTYQNLDIIFVNDCTPDDSIVKLNKLILDYPSVEPKVKVISLQTNSGVAEARNIGLLEAKGQYIIQFDSDDYVHPQIIEKLVNKAIATDADITFCDYFFIINEKKKYIKVDPSTDSKVCLSQLLTGVVHSSFCNKLIKKDIYIENHIFPIAGLNMREDMSVMFRVFYFVNKIEYVPEALYYYVYHKSSQTTLRMNDQSQKNAIQLISLIDDFYANYNINNSQLLSALCMFKAEIVSFLLLYGNLEYVSKNLSDSISLKHYLKHPTIPVYYKIIGCTFSMQLHTITIFLRKLFQSLFFLKSKFSF